MNLHKLSSKGHVALVHQLLNAAAQICADGVEPLLPMVPESVADSKNIGFCNIRIFGHDPFQFIAAQGVEEHHLLEVCRKPRVRYNQLRQKRMGAPAFFAFHPKDPKGDRSKGRFQSSCVIPMADQAASMATTAGKAVQVQVFDRAVIIFWCNHLVIFKDSCYHSGANRVAPLVLLGCSMKQEPTFSGLGFLLHLFMLKMQPCGALPHTPGFIALVFQREKQV